MADHYLLPCPCGRKIVVEPRRAGQMIPCECGAPLEVPTLVEMRRLERAEDAQEEGVAGTAWGNSQRVGLIGWIVLVAALAWTFAVFIQAPKPPRDQINVEYARNVLEAGLISAPPAETINAWNYFRRQGLSGIPEDVEKSYNEQVIRFRFTLAASLLVALAGFGLVAGAHVAGKRVQGAGFGLQDAETGN